MAGTPKANRRYTPPKHALIVSAEVPDGASARVKEGMTRRRLVAVTGRCPCGAVLEVPSRLEPGVLTLVPVEHEPTCPAVDVHLAEGLGS